MNTIDVYRTNQTTSFKERYLKFNKEEQIPRKIVEAVYKSDAVENLLMKDKRKNFFKRMITNILDFFRKDEVLEVSYYRDTVAQRSRLKNPRDPFESHATVNFALGKEGEENICNKLYYSISDMQSGIFNKKTGNSRVINSNGFYFNGEHPYYDKPKETVDDKLAKKIEDLDDLESKLRKLRDSED